MLQVTVTQTLSVILFSEQKLTHFTNISCEIQQNVVELIEHLSKHLPLRFNLATNEISLTKSPLNPAQCYTERFHQTEPFRSLILSTLIVNLWFGMCTMNYFCHAVDTKADTEIQSFYLAVMENVNVFVDYITYLQR